MHILHGIFAIVSIDLPILHNAVPIPLDGLGIDGGSQGEKLLMCCSQIQTTRRSRMLFWTD